MPMVMVLRSLLTESSRNMLFPCLLDSTPEGKAKGMGLRNTALTSEPQCDWHTPIQFHYFWLEKWQHIKGPFHILLFQTIAQCTTGGTLFPHGILLAEENTQRNITSNKTSDFVLCLCQLSLRLY